tara:strand:- start:53 stop:559 length:507 start_codon:yes stop_codon:yes gene_type:complete
MFKIIDNCITKNKQENIKKTMLGLPRIFPWYFSEDVSLKDGKQKRPAFFHDFVLGKYKLNSDFYNMIKPIVTNKNVIRARAILQLSLNKNLIGKKYDTPHIDSKEPHKVYLYYVINADGHTLFFKNNKVVKKIKPKQGRVVIFDGNIKHTAEQPKKGNRCIINFNVEV